MYYLTATAPMDEFYRNVNIISWISVKLAECGLFFECHQTDNREYEEEVSRSLRILCSLISHMQPIEGESEKDEGQQLLIAAEEASQ